MGGKRKLKECDEKIDTTLSVLIHLSQVINQLLRKKVFKSVVLICIWNDWIEAHSADVFEYSKHFELFLKELYVSQAPDYEPSLPVSEKSNPLTRDIDRASTNHIVRMLQACDNQMFQEEAGTTYQVKIRGHYMLCQWNILNCLINHEYMSTYLDKNKRIIIWMSF